MLSVLYHVTIAAAVPNIRDVGILLNGEGAVVLCQDRATADRRAAMLAYFLVRSY